jgi:hypothetical protein
VKIPGWRRLLIRVVAPLGAVALLGTAGTLAWWSWDAARQPEVTDAVPVLRRALADTVTAAGQDAAAAIGGVARSAQCQINPLRTGGVFTARADLYTDPGGEDDLITGIATRLSGSYPVTRGTALSGVRPLTADAGQGVRLAVRRLGPGWLSVTARSGCSRGSVPDPQAPPPNDPGVAAVTATFAALGGAPRNFVANTLECPGGGALNTVSGVSQPMESAGLDRRLAGKVPADARRFASADSNRVAYRAGAVSVIVAASDDGTTVTGQYTTAC